MSSPIHRSLVVVTSLALLLGAAPSLTAQTPEQKAATKELGKAQKEAVKTFKADLKDPQATVIAAIKTFEGNAKAGGTFVDDLNDELVDVSTALSNFDVAVVDALDDANLFMAIRSDLALDNLPGNDLFGLYPAGFYAGDQGAVDKYADDIVKQIGLAYKKVDKSLNKAVKTARKAGANVAYRLCVPTNPYGFAPNQVPPDQVVLSTSPPLAFTHVLCGSDGATLLGGVICLGGIADATLNGGTVNVIMTGPDGDPVASAPNAIFVAPTGSWRLCIGPNNFVNNLEEGNYLLEVTQAVGAQVERFAFGLP